MRWFVAAVLAVAGAGAAAETIVAARYGAPTARYDHAVLGDALEWGALLMSMRDGTARRVDLPRDHVFEDTAPRLVDVTGDGAPEVIVVETDVNRGAALAVYGAQGKIAETPHIGQRNRWLAPLGAADLDGDGVIEIAYVDRPHLARVLRVWQLRGGELHPVAQLERVTNHRIGESHISGGIRDCGAGPEMILASADWTRVIAVTLRGGELTPRDLGPLNDSTSLEGTLICQ